jgi:hypothetical protein
MCTVCGIGVLLINLTVTLSPSVNLKVGPGIVPLYVQVFTTFPGAISSSASCAINVYSFRVGDVIVVVELLAVVASASVGPLILLSLSVPIGLEKEITVPIIADAIRIPHSTMVRALLPMSDNLFDISY